MLAAQIDNNDLKDENCFRLARRTVASDKIPVLKAPALVGKLERVPAEVVRKNTSHLSFECSSKVASASFELVPFNRIHFNRYAVYFPVYKSRDDYEQAYAKEKDEILENNFLEANTIDRVRLESSDSEKEHKLDGVNTSTGDTYGCAWRHASDGGYFMYQMAVIPGMAQSVCLKSIRTDHGSRVFDVLVNGRMIATLDHSQAKKTPRLFYYEMLPIPEDLIGNKRHVTVKLYAKRGNMAGGIFDLRIIKRR